MARLFGTDGVRGVANAELTCELAYRLGQAAVLFLGDVIVVGKDTRRSGDMLEAAVSAGVMSAGGTVLSAGIIPTPAVALLTRELHANGGIVISASHNPPEYNGIKLFDAQGFKLSDETEDCIERFIADGGLEAACAHLDETEARSDDTAASETPEAGAQETPEADALKIPDAEAPEMPTGARVGVRIKLDDAQQIYIDHAVATVRSQGIDLNGLHVALDAGHGAASFTTAEALRELGAQVSVINEDFDGTDINVNCGSTHLDALRAFLAECGADVGIAHDGDADRVLLIDTQGNEIDGDMIEAVCALDMKERGVLKGNTAVTTVMCNLGFVHAMRDAGISIVQTQVGDRYVLEEMRANDYSIGGEQSGHMILLEHNSTGDGLVTALQFLAACRRANKTPGEAARVMTRFPQTLINVRVADKHSVAEQAAVLDALAAAEAELGDNGRVLLRSSGTEPLVRVMVEASDAQTAERLAARIAQAVESVG